MDQISTALTSVIAVSVAVERVVEVLKQMFPLLNNERTDARQESWRRAGLQVLAAAVGTGIASYGQLQLGSHNDVPTHIVIGLMCSAGSGFWNHALDAMRAVKINKEVEAETSQQAFSRQPAARTAG